MGNSTEYFKYPITCCNISNIFTTNWNDLPLNQLESVAYCAINGTNINPTVSLFDCIKNK
jgi:hypothetical protein